MRNYIPHIIIAVLLIAIVFQCTDQISLKERVATEKQKVKDLEKDVASKNANILNLNSKKDSLNVLIGNLNQKIASAKSQIITIRQKKDEKINIVNSYTAEQLQKFFSDNYPN